MEAIAAAGFERCGALSGCGAPRGRATAKLRRQVAKEDRAQAESAINLSLEGERRRARRRIGVMYPGGDRVGGEGVSQKLKPHSSSWMVGEWNRNVRASCGFRPPDRQGPQAVGSQKVAIVRDGGMDLRAARRQFAQTRPGIAPPSVRGVVPGHHQPALALTCSSYRGVGVRLFSTWWPVQGCPSPFQVSTPRLGSNQTSMTRGATAQRKVVCYNTRLIPK